jgi:hypothetical protein
MQPDQSWHTQIFNVTYHGDLRTAHSHLEIGHSEPAPWSSRPLLVRCHAFGDLFRVQVDVGHGDLRKINVDGGTLAKILRWCPYYQLAARDAPGGNGLLMSCVSGHPQGSAASDLAKYMHAHGSKRSWFAPTGIGHELGDIPGRPGTSGVGSTQAWNLHDGTPITEKFKRYGPSDHASGSYASGSSAHASGSDASGSSNDAPVSDPSGSSSDRYDPYMGYPGSPEY